MMRALDSALLALARAMMKPVHRLVEFVQCKHVFLASELPALESLESIDHDGDERLLESHNRSHRSSRSRRLHAAAGGGSVGRGSADSELWSPAAAFATW